MRLLIFFIIIIVFIFCLCNKKNIHIGGQILDVSDEITNTSPKDFKKVVPDELDISDSDEQSSKYNIAKFLQNVIDTTNNGKWTIDGTNISEKYNYNKNSIILLFKKTSTSYYDLNNSYDNYVINQILDNIFLNPEKPSTEAGYKKDFESTLHEACKLILKDYNNIVIKNIKVNKYNEDQKVLMIYI
jgi:hypothetical protein